MHSVSQEEVGELIMVGGLCIRFRGGNRWCVSAYDVDILDKETTAVYSLCSLLLANSQY